MSGMFRDCDDESSRSIGREFDAWKTKRDRDRQDLQDSLNKQNREVLIDIVRDEARALNKQELVRLIVRLKGFLERQDE
jgi:hypothetical protein